jgi:uncharacterized protein
MIEPIKRGLLITGGILSLALGIIGAFLPLLPTVPLVLLSAFCFARSSEKLHSWLISNRYFGPIVRNFESGRGIPRRIKIRAIIMLWLSLGFSCWIVNREILCVMLGLIGLGTTIYLYRLPTYQADNGTDSAKQRTD